jgi:hypothetical protein
MSDAPETVEPTPLTVDEIKAQLTAQRDSIKALVANRTDKIAEMRRANTTDKAELTRVERLLAATEPRKKAAK